MERLHLAVADDAEDVVGGLVGREDVGTEETEGVYVNGPEGVRRAAQLVEAAQGDGVAVVSIDVEMVGDGLACRHAAVAENPLRVVGVLRVS